MKKIITLILCGLLVAGCTSTQKLNIQTTPVTREQLNLPKPPAVDLSVPQWTVITQNNYEEVFKEMRAKDPNAVLLAVSPDGYKDISVNDFKLQQYIIQLNKEFDSYKSYYEPPVSPSKTGN